MVSVESSDWQERAAMGYEHYWKRPPILDPEPFVAWSRNVRKVIDAFPRGILCGRAETAEPETTPTMISFNGLYTSDADRIAMIEAFRGAFSERFTEWLSLLPVDGSVPFVVPQAVEHPTYFDWSRADGRGWLDQACKTRQKIYDIAVTAALILLAYHFPDSCRVTSDGLLYEWLAGLELAERTTGLKLQIPIYSHKLWYPESLSRETFANWSADMQKVISATDVPLAGPDGIGQPIAAPGFVAFNGIGQDAYDPFFLSCFSVPNDGRTLRHGWVYWECQTMGNAGRRYDQVVIAALILFAHHFFPAEAADSRRMESYQLWTKSDENTWQHGADLVWRATGVRKHVSVDVRNCDVTIT